MQAEPQVRYQVQIHVPKMGGWYAPETLRPTVDKARAEMVARQMETHGATARVVTV